jgi:O-acetyl-ADP-ribose deacetylase (regulator of RNase III)
MRAFVSKTHMTLWLVHNVDILDATGDGVICSANPNLNLSGGVGGAFLLRYGTEMQERLHRHLNALGRKFVKPGTVVTTPSCGSPFTAIAHAVAIDAFYDTNAELITRTYRAAIEQLAQRRCRNLIAACLGCGYGRCSSDEFMKSILALVAEPFDLIDTFTFVTTNTDLATTIATGLGNAKC